MIKDMFGIEIRIGHYLAYIGASEYAKKRKGFVNEIKGWHLKMDGGTRWIAGYNCVSLETETGT